MTVVGTCFIASEPRRPLHSIIGIAFYLPVVTVVRRCDCSSRQLRSSTTAIIMAPQVKKAKTAFMFYQADQLAKIRAELGGTTSMGEAMTEVRNTCTQGDLRLSCCLVVIPTIT